MLQKMKNYHLFELKRIQWTKNITTRLVMKGITPNEVALSSMAFAQLTSFAFLLAFCFNSNWFTSFCLILVIIGILLRSICNELVDNVEKEGGVHSPFSPIYHTFADRYSDVVIFLGMGYGLWMYGWSGYIGWAVALCAVINAYIDLFIKTYRLKQSSSIVIINFQSIILIIAALLAIIICEYNRSIIYTCLILLMLAYIVTISLKTYDLVKNLDE